MVQHRSMASTTGGQIQQQPGVEVSVVEPSIEKKEVKRLPKWYHGGVASATAACCTHPLDLIKVHLQTHAGSAKVGGLQMASTIVRGQGVTALYNGLTASVGRQLTYSLTRFGVYDVVRPLVAENRDPILLEKMAIASFAGFCGGIVGTPCDVINVRMQNDIKLKKELRRNYRNVFDGLFQVASKEGPAALFNGVAMATMRAVLITNGQIAFYDQIKNYLLQTGYFTDTMGTHFFASFCAGGIATGMTQPADVMKTRMMNAKKNEYRGVVHCVTSTFKQGGLLAFFKGFTPAFIRLGPQTILTWLFKEQLRLNFGTIKKDETL